MRKRRRRLPSLRACPSMKTNYGTPGMIILPGIDEVGRGPLAGPVVAAAVILPHDFHLPDSRTAKRCLSGNAKHSSTRSWSSPIATGISIIGPEVIDDINIYEATKKAMSAAIGELSVQPDHLLIDAMPLTTPYPSRSIIKGDATSISIAAASIIAKVNKRPSDEGVCRHLSWIWF